MVKEVDAEIDKLGGGWETPFILQRSIELFPIGFQLQHCADRYGVAMSMTAPHDGATHIPVRLLLPVTTATVYIQASLLST